jgi:hypothetical protein
MGNLSAEAGHGSACSASQKQAHEDDGENNKGDLARKL